MWLIEMQALALLSTVIWDAALVSCSFTEFWLQLCVCRPAQLCIVKMQLASDVLGETASLLAK